MNIGKKRNARVFGAIAYLYNVLLAGGRAKPLCQKYPLDPATEPVTRSDFFHTAKVQKPDAKPFGGADAAEAR